MSKFCMGVNGRDRNLMTTPYCILGAKRQDYKMASGSDKLEDLEDRLEGFIESLRAVGVIAGDFQPSGQPVLNTKLYVV